MAPTMTLDTISKIRMVLAVWLMVMRIARWAVFSVQMSFESFRIGTIYLKSRDIVTDKVFLQASSRLLPTCPKLSSTIPILVSKNSTTFLVITSTTSLHCSSLSDIQTATDLISDPDGFLKKLKIDFPKRAPIFLVSKNETESKNSRSRLEARD